MVNQPIVGHAHLIHVGEHMSEHGLKRDGFPDIGAQVASTQNDSMGIYRYIRISNEWNLLPCCLFPIISEFIAKAESSFYDL